MATLPLGVELVSATGKEVISTNAIQHNGDKLSTYLAALGGTTKVVKTLNEITAMNVIYYLAVYKTNEQGQATEEIDHYDVYRVPALNSKEKIGTIYPTQDNLITTDNLAASTAVDSIAKTYVKKDANGKMYVNTTLASETGSGSGVTIVENKEGNKTKSYTINSTATVPSMDYLDEGLETAVENKIGSAIGDKYIRRYTIQERLKGGLGMIVEERNSPAFVIPNCAASASDDICRRNHGGNFHSMTDVEYRLLLQNFPSEWIENYKDIEGLNGMVIWKSNLDKEDGTDSDYHVFFPGIKNIRTGEYGTCNTTSLNETLYDSFTADGEITYLERYTPSYRRAVGYVETDDENYVYFIVNGRPFAVAKYNEGATHSNSDASTWYGSKYMFGATTPSTGTTTQADAPFWDAESSSYTKYGKDDYLSAYPQGSRLLTPAIYTIEKNSETESILDKIARKPYADIDFAEFHAQDTDSIVDLGYITSLSYDFGGARHIGELTVFFTTGDTFDFDVTGVDHIGDFDPQPNKRYVMSVLNGVAVLGEITEEE